MKPTLLLLTAMSCVAQTNTNYLRSEQFTNYIVPYYTNIENQFVTYFRVSTDYKTVTILDTNTIIKCTPGLSPIISKDTNGMWTVEFRKE